MGFADLKDEIFLSICGGCQVLINFEYKAYPKC